MTGACGPIRAYLLQTGLHDLRPQSHPIEITVQRSFDLLPHIQVGNLRARPPGGGVAVYRYRNPAALFEVCLLPEATMMEKCCTPIVLPASRSVMV